MQTAENIRAGRLRSASACLKPTSRRCIPSACRDYNPNRPRNEQGEWTSGGEAPEGFHEQGGKIVAFHGTTEEVARDIIKNGIRVEPDHRSFANLSFIADCY